MIALTRIDNRLIHGQVIEGWLPYLRATRIVVADEQSATHPLTRMAMLLAVPAGCSAEIRPLAEIDFDAVASGPERTLLVMREVADAVRARELGLALSALNLGNIHSAPGRVPLTPSVFLSHEEIAALRELAEAGVHIDLRAVPRDKPLTMADIEARAGPPPPGP